MNAEQPPPVGPAISLRETLPTSKWLGVVCPRCGNTLAEGEQVVLCPKCYTPQHAQCWRNNGNQCGACGTPARIIERPGRAAAASAAAQPAAGTPDYGAAYPSSPTPAQPTPSMDTAAAATDPAGAAQATRPATARAGPGPSGGPPRPRPPRPMPSAAARAAPGGGRGAAGRPAATPPVHEARGLRPLSEVRRRLEQVLGDLQPQFGVAVDHVTCSVAPERIPEAARRARDHELLQFDYLRCLSGVDYQDEGIEVVYHLFSMRLLQKCALKARIPGEGHGLPTVTTIWPGANWHERETAEMFNIRFDGHPHPEPLLLEKDEHGRVVPGPILLKRFPLRPKEPPGIYGFAEDDAQ
jgi:NADH-quinone oxidoreductase subunit C